MHSVLAHAFAKVFRCETGTGLLCNAEPGPPTDEICNHFIDDSLYSGAVDRSASFPRVDIAGNLEVMQ